MSTDIIEVRQYLMFTLNEELFAIDVSQVREVQDYSDITKIPGTPDYLRGVINLRGGLVPVIDLHLKFGMEKREKKSSTCIIVMEIGMDDEKVVIGALADTVQEVYEIEPDQIEPVPRLGTKFKTEFLQGLGKRKNKFIMILNIEKIFSSEELFIVRDNQGKEENLAEVLL